MACAVVFSHSQTKGLETMKTVFTNSQCAHVWAQQSQEHGRGASVSFRGPIFRSYATPVAAFVRDTLGRNVCLISNRRYSNTTARHISHARRALADDVFVFNVHEAAPGGWNGDGGDHTVNLRHLAKDYEKQAERGMYAFEVDDWQRNGLRGSYNHMRYYALAFALPVPRVTAEPDSAIRQWDARQAALNASPRRAAAAAAKARREAENLARRIAADTEARAQWMAGTVDNGYRYITCPLGGAMLRVTGDRVVTSWGAECPLEDARRVFALYLRLVGKGEVITRGGLWGDETRLGHFRLDSIDADGNVTAGCHKIYRAELERVAAQLSEVQS
jgi:hypothetical protein